MSTKKKGGFRKGHTPWNKGKHFNMGEVEDEPENRRGRALGDPIVVLG